MVESVCEVACCFVKANKTSISVVTDITYKNCVMMTYNKFKLK